MCDYAAADWDALHASTAREWLLPPEACLAALHDALEGVPHDAPILELGCGTSSLASALRDEGWSDVLGTDLSRRAVADADARHARPGLRFAVADARDLSTAVADGSVAAALDKGTLDAICCGEGFDYEARRVAASVVRALRPGGVWACVSLMPPSVVLPLMRRAEWTLLQAEPLERTGLHVYRGVRGAAQ